MSEYSGTELMWVLLGIVGMIVSVLVAKNNALVAFCMCVLSIGVIGKVICEHYNEH